MGLSDQVPDRVLLGGKSFVKNGDPHGALGVGGAGWWEALMGLVHCGQQDLQSYII